MADFVYNVAKFQLLGGEGLDLSNGADTIQVMGLEAASDENPDDAEMEAVLVRAGTTELTSTGYSTGGHTLLNQLTRQDDTNDRGEFDADNLVLSAISQAGSETLVAFIIKKEVGAEASDIPIAFVDSPSELPITPNGSDITFTWDAEGILQTT